MKRTPLKNKTELKRGPAPKRKTPIKVTLADYQKVFRDGPITLARKKRLKAKRSTVRRVSVLRAPKYLAELRLMYCEIGVKFGSEQCSSVTDPAHGPVNGMGSKGPDSGAIPLCRSHHREQHQIGWPRFERKYGINREEVAARTFAAWEAETA